MSDSWENAVEIRRAMCDDCKKKDVCLAAYDPDLPCPGWEMKEEDFTS